MIEQQAARRQLLKLLVSSPLIAPFIGIADVLGGGPSGVISDPDRALNVFDFEVAARQALSPAHFAYIATGVDDDATLRANREGFEHFRIRVRRLIDVREVDSSVELFGQKWETPIVLAPAGSQRGFHDEGESAVARAARARKHLMILSTVSSTSIEEVIAARGGPVWFQLYPTDRPPIARALVKRAEAAGCPVLVLTVDIQGGSNRETLERAVRLDDRDCSACHDGRVFSDPAAYVARKPMFKGLDVSGVTTIAPMDMTWDFVRRLRDLTDMPLVIKGIVTREDAALAMEQGVNGLIVSNHGGRAEESGRATIDCLPEVVEGTGGKIPVMVDGGFRRGGDIFKALALGASAVCIGRPYLWGLGAFGRAGVEAVLSLLRRELAMIMRQAGVLRIGAIDQSYLADHRCR